MGSGTTGSVVGPAIRSSVLAAAILAAAVLAGTCTAWAQGQAPGPGQAQPSPADPGGPPPAVTPAPPEAAPPASPPPAAGAPPLPPDDVVQSAGFGDEVTLTARPALVLAGKTTWDDLYGAFRKAIGQLSDIARGQGLTVTGAPMIRFVSSSDDAVDYEAILPVAGLQEDAARYQPARPGETPAGQALRFVHFGGYDTMEQTYDEITNHLDERAITAEDAFVEEYVRDPEKTPETDLATFIYVFPKRQ